MVIPFLMIITLAAFGAVIFGLAVRTRNYLQRLGETPHYASMNAFSLVIACVGIGYMLQMLVSLLVSAMKVLP